MQFTLSFKRTTHCSRFFRYYGHKSFYFFEWFSVTGANIVNTSKSKYNDHWATWLRIYLTVIDDTLMAAGIHSKCLWLLFCARCPNFSKIKPSQTPLALLKKKIKSWIWKSSQNKELYVETATLLHIQNLVISNKLYHILNHSIINVRLSNHLSNLPFPNLSQNRRRLKKKSWKLNHNSHTFH